MKRVTATRAGVRTEPDYRGQPDRYCINCGIKLSSANHSRKPPVACKDCNDTQRRWLNWVLTR